MSVKNHETHRQTWFCQNHDMLADPVGMVARVFLPSSGDLCKMSNPGTES